MSGRADVASLVELLIGCQQNLVGNKLQSKRITERILSLMSLPVSDDIDWFIVYALLAKIFGFIAQFINKSYFVSTWMINDDKFSPYYDELDSLIESLGLSIPFDSNDRILDRNADADEIVLLVRNMWSGPGHYPEKTSSVVRSLVESSKVDRRLLPPLRKVNNALLGQDMAVVGKGKFGVVRKTHLRGVPVALKPLSTTASGTDDTFREALLLQLYTFQGVIRYVGVDDCIRPTCVYLELALCSLRDALFTEQYQGILDMTLKGKLVFLTSLCSAFTQLHSHGIVHRDIKSSNVLVCSDLTLKVSDFGLTSDKLFNVTQPSGSCAYMAPELLMYHEQYEYSESTDMFAFTVMLNEVLTEIVPLRDLPPGLILAKMYQSQGTFRPALYAGEQAQSVDSVITSGWHVDPSQRLTFQQLLTHLQMLEAVVCGLDSSFFVACSASSVSNAIESIEISNVDDN